MFTAYFDESEQGGIGSSLLLGLLSALSGQYIAAFLTFPVRESTYHQWAQVAACVRFSSSSRGPFKERRQQIKFGLLLREGERDILLFPSLVPFISSEEVMTSVWKRLQRVGKKASKFQFVASYQELVLECTKKWWVWRHCVSALFLYYLFVTVWTVNNPQRGVACNVTNYNKAPLCPCSFSCYGSFRYSRRDEGVPHVRELFRCLWVPRVREAAVSTQFIIRISDLYCSN